MIPEARVPAISRALAVGNKKDAVDVRRKNKDLIRNCNSQLATTEQLAELVAEYQALNLRQKGHGRIWRFFHSGENDERTELLNDMKAAIIKAIGVEVSLEPEDKNPSEIAMLLNNRIIEKNAAEASKPDAFASRYKITNMVEYDPAELGINIPKENKDNQPKEEKKEIKNC